MIAALFSITGSFAIFVKNLEGTQELSTLITLLITKHTYKIEKLYYVN
jgi:hypothetical protein